MLCCESDEEGWGGRRRRTEFHILDPKSDSVLIPSYFEGQRTRLGVRQATRAFFVQELPEGVDLLSVGPELDYDKS